MKKLLLWIRKVWNFPEEIPVQILSKAQSDWLYAHCHPRSSSANKILVQCTAPHLIQFVINPLKIASIEAESQVQSCYSGLQKTLKISVFHLFLF
jgi:hypothetical protein